MTIYALVVGLIAGACIGVIGATVILANSIDQHRRRADRATRRMHRAHVDGFERTIRAHNARVAAREHLGTPYIDGHRVLRDNDRWSRRAS